MIRIAIPSKGSLKKESLDFLNRIGIKLPDTGHEHSMYAINFPLEIISMPEVDILSFVQSGMMDIGLVGKQYQEEKNAGVIIHRELGIARHNLSISGTPNTKYKNLETLNGKTILTPFPNYLTKTLKAKNIRAKVQGISESLTAIPHTDFNEFFFDAIPVGLTLDQNKLTELELVDTFETLLVSNKDLNTQKRTIFEELISRIDATTEATDKQVLTMRVPTIHITEVLAILPSPKPPIVTAITNELSLIQTVVDYTRFWDIITKLKQLKAEEIILMPIAHLIH